MRRFLTCSVIVAGFVFNAMGQDWYQQRQLSEDQWRLHLFSQVKQDLEHVWTGVAKDKELERLAKTENQLAKMQTDLDQTRWDNGLVNDVIDSISKSADDKRLQPRDRGVLAEDVRRLKQFQDLHNHPAH